MGPHCFTEGELLRDYRHGTNPFYPNSWYPNEANPMELNENYHGPQPHSSLNISSDKFEDSELKAYKLKYFIPITRKKGKIFPVVKNNGYSTDSRKLNDPSRSESLKKNINIGINTIKNQTQFEKNQKITSEDSPRSEVLMSQSDLISEHKGSTCEENKSWENFSTASSCKSDEYRTYSMSRILAMPSSSSRNTIIDDVFPSSSPIHAPFNFVNNPVTPQLRQIPMPLLYHQMTSRRIIYDRNKMSTTNPIQTKLWMPQFVDDYNKSYDVRNGQFPRKEMTRSVTRGRPRKKPLYTQPIY